MKYGEYIILWWWILLNRCNYTPLYLTPPHTMSQESNQLHARQLLKILKRRKSPLTNQEIDILAINNNYLSLMNVKWYAQRDLEYMGMLWRVYPKRSKNQRYYLTEKWRSMKSFDEMTWYWFLIALTKFEKKNYSTLRSPIEEQIVKKENIDMNNRYWNAEEAKWEIWFQELQAPEIEPTTLLGRVRKFFLSFKS